MVKASSVVAGVFVLVGIVLLIIGIVLYEVNLRNKSSQQWWVWALMIGGLVVAVLAGIALAFTLR